ncbi:MAG: family 16 glycoside hydrolase [Verrucomicrobiales bacterium]
MKIDSRPYLPAMFAIILVALSVSSASAQFHGDPPDDTHPWAVHDMNRPQPPLVTPGKTPGAPPSDAIVLFDGTAASFKANWEHEKKDRKADWQVVDGAVQCAKNSGTIRSRAQFADCQLHVEWAAPSKVQGSSQGRGNSGIFLMGATEVQVLDNFKNPTYPDGFAGSVYGVMPPAANPLHAPGQWQSYDIIFRRPVVKDGVVLDGGSFTVLINGVVVQDSTPLEGGGGHKGRSKPKVFPEKGPLKIQDHGNPVRFRNIWYRPLRKRPVDGGTDGKLSVAATMAKRAEIAADLRRDAAAKKGKDRLLCLMESLCYEVDDEAVAVAEEEGEAFMAGVKANPAGRKGDVIQVNNAVKYLVKHERMPSDHPVIEELKALIKVNGWDK